MPERLQNRFVRTNRPPTLGLLGELRLSFVAPVPRHADERIAQR
jgi:hypothetical protein